jgi:hypothetical protein
MSHAVMCFADARQELERTGWGQVAPAGLKVH